MNAAAQTIDDVIVRMQSIQTALPAGDGVACFNRMYLQVTEGVNQRDHTGQAFLLALGIVVVGIAGSNLLRGADG